MYQALPCDPKRASGAPIPNSASAASTSALVGSASHLSTPSARRRILSAYWILGLCNNYGYVIMLSAATTILDSSFLPDAQKIPGPRECNELSTGAILLADILPSLFIKFISPFFPLWIHTRMSAVIVLNLAGFVLVAMAQQLWVVLTGVVCMSIASGLGEVSLLAYTAFFKDKTVITMWSSGTGGAGVLGAASFLLLKLVLSPRDTLLVMTVVPFIMALTFWVLMVHPRLDSADDEPVASGEKPVIVKVHDDVPVSATRASFVDKLRDVPPLLKYIVPLTLVYFFEYFINQGLYELIHYPTLPGVTHAYEVFQVVYQVGVFISRSSGSYIHIQKIWILSALQGVNVIYFTLEAIYGFSSSAWVVAAMVLLEGLLGGGAYVNTYFYISKEVAPEKREFSMAMSSVGDAIGISASAIAAIAVHNKLCELPLY
ncbi:battenin-like isoform X2 [Thrips palmi]|uniref:Battenin n=1 Tax=Thrips palmi TaxID=161013 RepID=A0A6P8YNM7_THRPL|nr:battenin-like isoform X2 [Thrips palmi]